MYITASGKWDENQEIVKSRNINDNFYQNLKMFEESI